MSQRESFLAALRGEPAREVVWTADLTYWMTGERCRGRGRPEWDAEEGYLRFHRECGVMPYYYYAKFWLGEPQYGGGIRESSEAHGNRTIRRVQTPRGDLTEESVWLPESFTAGITKHLVATPADLDILRYVIEHRVLRPAALDDYAARLELWHRYDGIPSIALPRSPFSALAYEWAGIQNLVMLVADCEPAVRDLLDLMAAQEEPVLAAVAAAAPPVVHFADNLASDNFTSYYDAFLAPTHRRRLARLHEAGVRCAVHLDGAVRGLLPKLAAVGFDAVEALTPRPVGDLDLAAMRRVAGSTRLVLWGGVPGAMFAPPFTWRDMAAHVRQLLAAWRGTPFIVGVADQVPPDGDIRFCRRIAELLG